MDHPLYQKVVDQLMKARGPENGLTGEELKAVQVEVVFHLAGAAIMQCLNEGLIEAIDIKDGDIVWQRCEAPSSTPPIVTLN